jgi:hypothetical protein
MSDDGKMLAHLLRRDARAINETGLVFAAERAIKAAKLIDSQAALIERLTLRWSSERPMVVGEYLIRCKSSGLRDENLFLDDDDTPIAWDDDWEFAGPIIVSEPEDKNQS